MKFEEQLGIRKLTKPEQLQVQTSTSETLEIQDNSQEINEVKKNISENEQRLKQLEIDFAKSKSEIPLLNPNERASFKIDITNEYNRSKAFVKGNLSGLREGLTRLESGENLASSDISQYARSVAGYEEQREVKYIKGREERISPTKLQEQLTEKEIKDIYQKSIETYKKTGVSEERAIEMAQSWVVSKAKQGGMTLSFQQVKQPEGYSYIDRTTGKGYEVSPTGIKKEIIPKKQVQLSQAEVIRLGGKELRLIEPSNFQAEPKDYSKYFIKEPVTTIYPKDEYGISMIKKEKELPQIFKTYTGDVFAQYKTGDRILIEQGQSFLPKDIAKESVKKTKGLSSAEIKKITSVDLFENIEGFKEKVKERIEKEPKITTQQIISSVGVLKVGYEKGKEVLDKGYDWAEPYLEKAESFAKKYAPPKIETKYDLPFLEYEIAERPVAGWKNQKAKERFEKGYDWTKEKVMDLEVPMFTIMGGTGKIKVKDIVSEAKKKETYESLIKVYDITKPYLIKGYEWEKERLKEQRLPLFTITKEDTGIKIKNVRVKDLISESKKITESKEFQYINKQLEEGIKIPIFVLGKGTADISFKDIGKEIKEKSKEQLSKTGIEEKTITTTEKTLEPEFNYISEELTKIYGEKIGKGEITEEQAIKEFEQTEFYKTASEKYSERYSEEYRKELIKQEKEYYSDKKFIDKALSIGKYGVLYGTEKLGGKIEEMSYKDLIKTSAYVYGGYKLMGALPKLTMAYIYGYETPKATYKLATPRPLSEKLGAGAELGLIAGVTGYMGYKKWKTPSISREDILISPKLTKKQKIPKLSKVLRQEKVIDVYGDELTRSIQKASYIDEQLLTGERVIVKQRSLLSPISKKVIYEGVPYVDKSGYAKAVKELKKLNIPDLDIEKTLRYTAPKRIEYKLTSQDLTKPYADVEVFTGTKIKTPRVKIKGAVTEKLDVYEVDKLLGIKTRGGLGKVKYIDATGEILQGKKDVELVKLAIREQEALLKGDIPFMKVSKAGKTIKQFEQVSGIKLLKEGEYISPKQLIKDLKLYKSTPVELYQEGSYTRQVIPKKRKIISDEGFVLVEKELKEPLTITRDLREELGFSVTRIKTPVKPKPYTKIEDYTKSDVKKLIKDLEKVYGKPKQQLVERSEKDLLKEISISAISSVKVKPTPRARVDNIKNIIQESNQLTKQITGISAKKVSGELLLGESKFIDLTGQGKITGLTTGKIKDLGVSETRFEGLKDLDISDQVTKIKSIVKTKEASISKLDNLEKELLKERVLSKLEPKFKEAEKLKSSLQTKQLTRLQLKNLLRARITPRARVTKFPYKIKTPPIIPLTFDFDYGKEDLKNILREDYKVYVKKYGKDVKIGEFKNLGIAEKELKDILKTTLRASGYIEKKGKRQSFENYVYGDREFRPAKKDIYRLVQKRGYRLGTREEVSEIQLAKLMKGIPQ